jgi:hypothetical protein
VTFVDVGVTFRDASLTKPHSDVFKAIATAIYTEGLVDDVSKITVQNGFLSRPGNGRTASADCGLGVNSQPPQKATAKDFHTIAN